MRDRNKDKVSRMRLEIHALRAENEKLRQTIKEDKEYYSAFFEGLTKELKNLQKKIRETTKNG